MKIKVPNGIDNEGKFRFNEVEIETEEAKLLAKIDKLTEALQFYADINNYINVKSVEEDEGSYAREVLKECGL